MSNIITTYLISLCVWVKYSSRVLCFWAKNNTHLMLCMSPRLTCLLLHEWHRRHSDLWKTMRFTVSDRLHKTQDCVYVFFFISNRQIHKTVTLTCLLTRLSYVLCLTAQRRHVCTAFLRQSLHETESQTVTGNGDQHHADRNVWERHEGSNFLLKSGFQKTIMMQPFFSTVLILQQEVKGQTKSFSLLRIYRMLSITV